jgi:hypothetical protein
VVDEADTVEEVDAPPPPSACSFELLEEHATAKPHASASEAPMPRRSPRDFARGVSTTDAVLRISVP